MRRHTKALVAAWLAAQPSENTRSAYGRDLSQFADWCDRTGRDLLAAAPDDLGSYRDACLRGGASPATVTRRLSGIASFFRFAASAGVLETNPVDDVERPTVEPAPPPTLDEAEVLSLVDAADTLGPKVAALVGLLALDGMKLGEVLRIDVPRVHLAGGAVAVDVDRRGERQRVEVAPRTAAALAAYVADRRRGPLFLGDSATAAGRRSRLSRFGADFLVKRAGAAAGIDKPVSASLLRRSYIESARRSGAPLDEIARHVGYKDAREAARVLGTT